MSQTSTLKGQCIAEFLGTGLLIFFGVGCVAALKVAGGGFCWWGNRIILGVGGGGGRTGHQPPRP
ncbi:aquaporin, partial [Enterobacter sp. T1-1]|uniref:aquaporin n=1 Tax=Enterobacter sp. T1-1 TaxID=1449966 RepID=UPI003FA424D6